MMPPRSPHAVRPLIRVQCAWCEREPDEEAKVERTSNVSHGICRPCALRYFGIDLTSENRR